MLNQNILYIFEIFNRVIIVIKRWKLNTIFKKYILWYIYDICMNIHTNIYTYVLNSINFGLDTKKMSIISGFLFCLCLLFRVKVRVWSLH